MTACTKCPQTRSPVPRSASITPIRPSPQRSKYLSTTNTDPVRGIFYNLSLSPPPLTISLNPHPSTSPTSLSTPTPSHLSSPLLSSPLSPPEGSQQPACQSGERGGARGMGDVDGGWEIGGWGMMPKRSFFFFFSPHPFFLANVLFLRWDRKNRKKSPFFEVGGGVCG